MKLLCSVCSALQIWHCPAAAPHVHERLPLLNSIFMRSAADLSLTPTSYSWLGTASSKPAVDAC